MSCWKWYSNYGACVDRKGSSELGREAFGEVELHYFLTNGPHDPETETKQTKGDASTAHSIGDLNVCFLSIEHYEEWSDWVCHIIRTMAETNQHGGQ